MNGPGAHPRTKPAQARREDLMNAAEALFLKLGVGLTTVEQITAGAGVAKGTFYLHFDSKEAVLNALRVRYVLAFQERLQTATDRCADDDWSGKLAAWAAAAVTVYLDSVPQHDLVFHEFETDGDHPDIVVEYLSGLLAEGAARGAWSVEDPRFTAVYLFNGLHGIVDDALALAAAGRGAAKKPLKRAQMIRKLQQLCFRLVGAAGAE
jgi:AcrR family transcriptional regulator